MASSPGQNVLASVSLTTATHGDDTVSPEPNSLPRTTGVRIVLKKSGVTTK